MTGRREVFPDSKKIGFSSPEFIQKKVYSVQFCISWLGYGPLPHGGCSCSWKEQWKENFDQKYQRKERHPIPPGTVLILGSVTHLQNVGTTLFATGWCNTVENLRTKLRNVKVIPGIPILREDGPGSLGRQLVELTQWFRVVYDKNTLGCLPVWEKLLENIRKTDEDGLDLGFTEFYTVALPPTLLPNSGLIPMKFKYSSSHTTIRGVDCEASYELLCTLLNHLQKEFASVANSDDILSREPAYNTLHSCGGE